MLSSTTNDLPGHRIIDTIGVVNGTSTAGTFFLWHYVLRLRDWIGGRTRSVENNINRCSEQAFEEMLLSAQRIGANAVVGARLNLVCMDSTGTTTAVFAYGTAVVIEDCDPSCDPSQARQTEGSFVPASGSFR